MNNRHCVGAVTQWSELVAALELIESIVTLHRVCDDVENSILSILANAKDPTAALPEGVDQEQIEPAVHRLLVAKCRLPSMRSLMAWGVVWEDCVAAWDGMPAAKVTDAAASRCACVTAHRLSYCHDM